MAQRFSTFDDWFNEARSREKNKDYSDQELIAYWLENYANEEQPSEEAPTERSWGEAITDTGVSVLKGVTNLIEGVGTMYGLATGDMDNAPRNFGAESGETLDSWKSDALRAKEQRRSEAINAAEDKGALSAFWAGLYETVRDPALFVSTLAEQAAMMVPGGAVGRGVGMAGRALGAGGKALGTAQTAGAIGTGALLQGGDVASETYDRLMSMPDEVWSANPDFQKLVGELGADAAKHKVSLGLTESAFGKAALASAASQAIPGGSTIERVLAGAGRGSARGMVAGALKGGLGEATQEAVEEGSGAYFGNVAAAEVDPSVDLMRGVGSAAGQGAAVGAGMGAPIGGIAGMAVAMRQSDKVLDRAVEDIQDDTDPDAIREKALAASQVSSEVLKLAAPQGTFSDVFDEAGNATLSPMTVETPAGVRPEWNTDLVGMVPEAVEQRRFASDDQTRDVAANLNANLNRTILPESSTESGVPVPTIRGNVIPTSASSQPAAPPAGPTPLGEAEIGVTPTAPIPGTNIPQTVLSDTDRSAKTIIPAPTPVNEVAFIPTMAPSGSFAVTRTNIREDSASLATAVTDIKAMIAEKRAAGQSTGAATDFDAELAPHEMVRGGSAAVGALSLMGIKVRFFKQTKGNTINGFVASDNSVWINMDSTNHLMEVAIHEATHVMERTAPELYQEFLGAMESYVSKQELDRVETTHGALGEARNEATANVSGAVAMRPDFWKHLAEQSPNVFRRVATSVLKFFDQLITKLRGQKVPMARIAEKQAAEASQVVAKYFAKYVEEFDARQQKEVERQQQEAAKEAERQQKAQAQAKMQADAQVYLDRQAQEPVAEDTAREMAGGAMVAARDAGVDLRNEEYGGPRTFALTERGAPDTQDRQSLRMRAHSPEAKAERDAARARQEAAIAEHHSQVQARNSEGKFSGGYDFSLVQNPEQSTEREQPQIVDKTQRSQSSSAYGAARFSMSAEERSSQEALAPEYDEESAAVAASPAPRRASPPAPEVVRGAATRSDFTEDNVGRLTGKERWIVLTAEDPGAKKATKKYNRQAMKQLREYLDARDIDHFPVLGKYGEEQNSIVVFGDKATVAMAKRLRQKFGQESVLIPEGLLYADDMVHPADGTSKVDPNADDYYTELPDGGRWQYGISFDEKIPLADATKLLRGNALNRVPEAQAPSAGLTQAEREALTPETARRFAEIFSNLPSEEEIAAVAYAGKAKRGWYRRSAQAIADLFGPDGPRFAMLLAAMSPQTSVEANLINALHTWKNWLQAGRPTDRETIVQILGRSVQGEKGEDSVLDAWVNNAVRSLTTEFPGRAKLSGPKVNSFYLNLLDNVEEVTNDAWMATFSYIDQALFGGIVRKDETGQSIGQKSGGYLAMSAKVRMAAQRLTELTGDTWTPAEVQETVWSWTKALYELRGMAGEKRTTMELLMDNEVTDSLIGSVPDFSGLFNEDTYKRVLQDAGYQPEALERGRGSGVSGNGESGVGRQAAAPFEGDRQAQLELAAAERLERRFNEVEVQLSVPAAATEPARGSGRDGSVSAVGIHFGKEGKLAALSGNRFGTGINGAEQERLKYAKDQRIKRRVYFYVAKDGPFNTKRREAGLGTHVYRAALSNLYEPGVSPNVPRTPVYSNEEFKIVDQGETSNRWESAVLDAGYDGYLIRNPDIAVVLNKDVRVEYVGQLGQGKLDFSVAEEKLTEDMGSQADYLKARAIENGFDGVEEFLRKDSAGFMTAAAEWRKANPRTDFSIFSPAFKKWFGDSKVVDEDGKPLVVYHGTGADFDTFSADDIPYRGGILAFFSSSKEFGNNYAGKNSGANVIPVYLKISKLFDPRKDASEAYDFYDYGGGLQDMMDINRIRIGNGEDIDLLTDDGGWIDREEFYDAVKDGRWDAIESKDFVHYLREQGYDGIVTVENGATNYAVFSPNQIKSAYNRGTWDASSENISFSIDDDEWTEELGLPEVEERGIGPKVAEDLDNYRENRSLTDDEIRTLGKEWMDYGRDPGKFAYPTSFETDLADIAYEMGGGKVKVVGPRPASRDDINYAGDGYRPARVWEMTIAGKRARVFEDRNGRVVLNVAVLEQGKSGGSLAYQIVGQWAFNNDKVFVGDPAGLSNRAMFRRAVNMMSSALRAGSTQHLQPHPDQREAGLDWRKGDDEYNIGSLALWIRDTLAVYAPNFYKGPDAAAEDRGDGGARTAAGLDEGTVAGGERTRSQVALTDRFLDRVAEESGGGDPGAADGAGAALRPDRVMRDGLVDRPLYSIPGWETVTALTSPAGRAEARAQLNDFVRSQKTFGWWDRTVGTQYNKAKKSPAFRKVFNLVQAYLDDVSRLANAASDMAPDVFRKMHHITDAFKNVGQDFSGKTDADLDSMSGALFDGTIDDRVWTNAELKARGMTDKQIEMYRQARRAINKSLDQLAVSDMIRTTKDHGIDAIRDLVADMTAIDASNRLIAALRLNGQSAAIVDPIIADIREKAAKVGNLKATGYAPLMRFGQYALEFELNGENHFLLFESAVQRGSVKRMMEADGATNVVESIMSSESYRLFRGMDPNSLELFANTATFEYVDAQGNARVVKLSEDATFQAYLRTALASRSALKRLIKRKKVPGYDKDGHRVLASFITSNARMASSNLHMQDAVTAAAEIDKRDGDVKDEAVKLVNYVRDPGEEAAGFRGLLFVNYLGGSIASAMVNMSQPVMMTYPYLAKFGAAKAANALRRGMKTAVARSRPLGALGAALKQAEESGIVEPHEIYQLSAAAGATLSSNRTIQRAMKLWGSFFSAAEVFNRRSTFVAAFEIASAMSAAELQKTGFDNAYDFAVDTVRETQGIYNKGNRPDWARGAVGATIFTFKQYSIGYLEFLNRLPKQQKAVALGILLLMSGIQGLPFADDLDDLIDTVGQGLGYNTNSQLWKQDALKAALGKDVSQFVLFGASSIPGVPLDIQGRMSLGNLIPGTGILKRGQANPTREALEALGVGGAFITSAMEGGKKVLTGDLAGAAAVAAPVSVRNLMKGMDMLNTGMYRDMKGNKVVDVDTMDAITKIVGFQPADVAKVQRATRLATEITAVAKEREAEIADKWAEGLAFRDNKKVREAMDELRQWNADNPETKIRIKASQIAKRVRTMKMDKIKRVEKTSPREIRAQVRQLLND